MPVAGIAHGLWACDLDVMLGREARTWGLGLRPGREAWKPVSASPVRDRAL